MGRRGNYMDRERPTLLPGNNADLHATDSELARRARQGDDAALHELLDRHAGQLFALAVALVGNAADAEDVVQETLLGALRGIRAFKGRSAVKTWLVGILVRQAARHHRSRGRRPVVSLDALSEASASAPGRGRPEPSTAELDIRMDVLAALETLSREHRQVVLLRELQGMSYEEMAQVLGVPRGTVESRLFRARGALRERLGGYLP